jgi:arylsulfatase A-like enzyme
VFTTDNGAEKCTWPDGGASPFRGEKDTNWEGGWRVPCVMRWPGVIEPGRVINDICSLQDFIPTFAAACGNEPDLVEKVKNGYAMGGKTYSGFWESATPFQGSEIVRTSFFNRSTCPGSEPRFTSYSVKSSRRWHR